MAKEKTTTKKSEKTNKKETKVKITKDMMLGDILQKKPEAAVVMMEYGLHCIGCHISTMETLEQGSMAHGLSDEDISEMVKKINEL